MGVHLFGDFEGNQEWRTRRGAHPNSLSFVRAPIWIADHLVFRGARVSLSTLCLWRNSSNNRTKRMNLN